MSQNLLLFTLSLLLLMAISPIIIILKRKYGKETFIKSKDRMKKGSIKKMGLVEENLMLLGGKKFLGFLLLIMLTPLIGSIIDRTGNDFLGPLGVLIFIFLGIIPYLFISYWNTWGKYLFAIWIIYWIYLFTE